MTSQRRYFSCPPIDEGSVTLAGEEFHHIANVMRARIGRRSGDRRRPGELGAGGDPENGPPFPAGGGNRIEMRSQACRSRVIIAPSLTKSHAMNWMIEKLSEMGVDEIWPVIAERTDAHFGAALLAKVGKDRLPVAEGQPQVLWRTEILPPVLPANSSTLRRESRRRSCWKLKARTACVLRSRFPSWPSSVLRAILPRRSGDWLRDRWICRLPDQRRHPENRNRRPGGRRHSEK